MPAYRVVELIEEIARCRRASRLRRRWAIELIEEVRHGSLTEDRARGAGAVLRVELLAKAGVLEERLNSLRRNGGKLALNDGAGRGRALRHALGVDRCARRRQRRRVGSGIGRAGAHVTDGRGPEKVGAGCCVGAGGRTVDACR